jgi:hypothetical protein
MAAFATHADLATRLGITLTSDEQTRATALLTTASGLVAEAAKQTIALVEDDELTIRGTNADRLLLPERPVVEVSSVTLDGVELSGWYLDGNVLVRNGFDADGVTLNWWGVGFGCPAQELVITYSHGYAADSIPSTVEAIVLEAVTRVWVNPGAVVGERHGSEQVQFMNGTPTGLLLTTAEQKAIRRMFGRRGGSVSQS